MELGEVFLCLQCWTSLYNLLKFGRMALFHVSLLSEYKERRITSFRLQLENHLQQVIPTEVRRMVEEMRALNKKLEDTLWVVRKRVLAAGDMRRNIFHVQNRLYALASAMTIDMAEAATEDYFKPIDKQAETIMIMQLEGKEKTM